MLSSMQLAGVPSSIFPCQPTNQHANSTRFLLCGLRLPRCVSTGPVGRLSCRTANECELELHIHHKFAPGRRRERVFLHTERGPLLSCRCRRRCALQVRPCAAACLPVCACTDALPRARRRPQRAMATAESDLEVRTMHVFISRALQKILKEAPKKLTALRTSCTSVLGACPRPAAAACARCEPAGRLLVPLNSTSPMLLWLLSMRRGAPEEWRRLLSTAAGGGRVAAGDAAAGDALGI